MSTIGLWQQDCPFVEEISIPNAYESANYKFIQQFAESKIEGVTSLLYSIAAYKPWGYLEEMLRSAIWLNVMEAVEWAMDHVILHGFNPYYLTLKNMLFVAA